MRTCTLRQQSGDPFGLFAPYNAQVFELQERLPEHGLVR
jgi:superfamily I DNA and/or RNA helicase